MTSLATAAPLPILDSTAVSKFVVMLIELTNTVFVNSTNVTTNIETGRGSAVYTVCHCGTHLKIIRIQRLYRLFKALQKSMYSMFPIINCLDKFRAREDPRRDN